jgi:hypothetical protein
MMPPVPFYESEVSFGLTTLLRVKGIAHAVGSVSVERVSNATVSTYHVTPTARVKSELSHILRRLLDRPFHLDRLRWAITGTEVRAVLNAGALSTAEHAPCKRTESRAFARKSFE